MGGVFIPIGGDFYIWSKENIEKLKEEGATYALFKDTELIYIGSTQNLKERFLHYWNTNFSEDPCNKIITNYKREYRSDYKNREVELLKEFEDLNGELPKCNNHIPSE